eukprot:126092-Pelagomonas_calceolata.AAC.8
MSPRGLHVFARVEVKQKLAREDTVVVAAATVDTKVGEIAQNHGGVHCCKPSWDGWWVLPWALACTKPEEKHK